MGNNLFPNKGLVKREASPVIWLTGLSGSGKSTIANELELALENRGIKSYVLDGDNVRGGLNKDLGFSDGDRKENIRRIAEVAKLFSDSGTIAITAFISPFREERESAKEIIGKGNFIEVYVNASLSVCEKRDVKGLYKKARAGEIKQFTGIDSPYEEPLRPDVIAESDRATISTCVEKILFELEKKGVLEKK
jgi:adenylylsulfate kinase